MTDGFNAKAVATRLAQATDSAQIYRLRRGLTKEQAAQVFALLSPVEKAAVTIAVKFGTDGTPPSRWNSCDSPAIIINPGSEDLSSP